MTVPAVGNRPKSSRRLIGPAVCWVLCLVMVMAIAGESGVQRVRDVVLWNGPKQVDQYVREYPQLRVLADQPTFNWLGESIPPRVVDAWVRAAAGKTLPLVLYAVPGRDSGGYSAGGSASSSDYLAWVGAVAHHVGGAPALIVLEPDALGLSVRMAPDQRQERVHTIGVAVDILKRKCPRARVYVDASTWVPPRVMAGLLKDANVESADGFSLNVSGHVSNPPLFRYGNAVSALTNGKHYIVDTSRNGKESDADRTDWCNVSGLGVGRRPGSVIPEQSRVDGLYWIKSPGVSDGTCNGGPPAGIFWPSNALELVSNAAL